MHTLRNVTCGWSDARDALEFQPTIEGGLAALERFGLGKKTNIGFLG